MAAAAAARERHGAAIGWVSVGQGAASCRSLLSYAAAYLCGPLESLSIPRKAPPADRGAAAKRGQGWLTGNLP